MIADVLSFRWTPEIFATKGAELAYYLLSYRRLIFFFVV